MITNDDDDISGLQAKAYIWIYFNIVRVLSILANPYQALKVIYKAVNNIEKWKLHRKWKWSNQTRSQQSRYTTSAGVHWATLSLPQAMRRWRGRRVRPRSIKLKSFLVGKNCPSSTSPPSPRAPPAGLKSLLLSYLVQVTDKRGTSTLVTNKRFS